MSTELLAGQGTDPRAVVERFVAALNDRDEAAIDALVAPAYVQHDETIAGGRDALKQYVRELRDRRPDVRFAVDQLLVDGDRVSGFSTILDGRGGSVRAGNVWRVADGRLIEHWEVTETSSDGAGTVLEAARATQRAPRLASLPSTRRVDVVETLNGVGFPDPYRWLEAESPEVKAWQTTRDDAARDWLQGLPGFERLHDDVAELFAEGAISPPRLRGGRWFRLRPDPERGQAVISVGDQPDGDGRVLVAPAELAPTVNGSCDWICPSPDGRLVAFGVSVDGDEQSTMHVYDVETAAPVVAPIPFVSGGRVAWLPDSTGCYYGAGLARDTEDSVKRIWFWAVGTPRPTEPLSLVTSERSLAPQVSPCGRWVGVTGNFICPRLLYVLDRQTDRWLDALPDGDDVRFSGTFVGDRYVAVTNVGADRNRLVAAPLETIGDPGTWHELVPEAPDGTLRSVADAGDHLVLCEYVDAASRIRIAEHNGTIVDELALPERGTVAQNGVFTFQMGGDPAVDAAEGQFTFVFSSPATPPAPYRYEIATRSLRRLGAAGRPPLDLKVTHGSARNGDHDVHYSVVTRGDADPAQPLPTAIVAYGGWNIVFLSELYLGVHAPIVAAGGAVVFAHLRGDATYGHRQWQDGKRTGRQNSYDDLYALVDHLVREGVSVPERIALYGTSTGGLLGGVAVTQRPELFCAVVSGVPLIDMCRFPTERFSEMFAEEYGDPADPTVTRALRAYSPYHNVPAGRELPAVLVDAAGSDIRCQPWHGRKLAAAFEAAQAGDQPILLRVHPGQGHAGVVAGPPHVIAEWIGFLIDRLGLSLDAATPVRKER